MKTIAHLSFPEIRQPLLTNFEDAFDNRYGIGVNNVMEGVSPIPKSPIGEVFDDYNKDKTPSIMSTLFKRAMDWS
jgi:hypothetical protein